MVTALNTIHDSGYIQACLTNNVNRSVEERSDVSAAMTIFDHVIESSKVGIRKPEPGFYTLACTTAGVQPERVIFLDDLGINLKPARAMGMSTIKVVSADQALGELEGLLGLSLR
jgi:putative hydrolase of the HAD superfamily